MNNISAATEFAGSEQIGHCFLFNPQCCVSHDLLGKHVAASTAAQKLMKINSRSKLISSLMKSVTTDLFAILCKSPKTYIKEIKTVKIRIS